MSTAGLKEWDAPGPTRTVWLSIVIPAKTAPKMIRDCLKGISLNISPERTEPIEVITVDDGSEMALDETVGSSVPLLLIPNGPASRVAVIRHAVSQGRSRARNAGLAIARGTHTLFLDCDGVIAPDFLIALAAHLQDHPVVSIRGNRRVSPTLTSKSPYLRYFDSRFLGARLERGEALPPLDALPPNFFATGEMTVPTHLVRQLGGFDEAFSEHGCEDEELGWRLAEAGIPLHFLPSAHVVDLDSEATYERACDRMVNYASHSFPILLARHRQAATRAPFPILELKPNSLLARTLRFPVVRGLLGLARALVVQSLTAFEKQASGVVISGKFFKAGLGFSYILGFARRKRHVGQS